MMKIDLVVYLDKFMHTPGTPSMWPYECDKKCALSFNSCAMTHMMTWALCTAVVTFLSHSVGDLHTLVPPLLGELVVL